MHERVNFFFFFFSGADALSFLPKLISKIYLVVVVVAFIILAKR